MTCILAGDMGLPTSGGGGTPGGGGVIPQKQAMVKNGEFDDQSSTNRRTDYQY